MGYDREGGLKYKQMRVNNAIHGNAYKYDGGDIEPWKIMHFDHGTLLYVTTELHKGFRIQKYKRDGVCYSKEEYDNDGNQTYPPPKPPSPPPTRVVWGSRGSHTNWNAVYGWNP